MNLTCKINGIEYPIVQGNTFADEYNETLDSGSVIIAHVKKIKKLKPFDDVFVYDSNFKFGGYSYGTDALKPGDVVDTNGNKKLDNIFFKHLLVDNYTEEFVNLKDKTYKYKISLMSETKGLEKVQCPNISVTQPLNPDKKVSIYTYLQRFVSMYSPKFKKVMNEKTKTWVYVSKYKVDSSLEKIFGNVYPPDFSLNAPTLRDILSKLMVCKDMIPYVENGVIKAMDITQRKNEFSLDDIPTTNIVGSMSSNDYCDALRRNYSDGLSQDSTCESVEYLGFRNSETSLMTLGNMRLETRFPIYKINKLYMCYYKKSALVSKDNQEYWFLCKQDITPLVKLNTERNVLSKDWEEFEETTPTSIKELAQYKLATLGYDIGSKYITGWGEQYSYPKGWWLSERKTYIENILEIVDSLNENGIYQYDTFLTEDFKKEDFLIDYSKSVFDNIITPFGTPMEKNLNVKSALDMKGLFFEIDYQGFFNGSVVVSKDNGLDNIVSNDNSSSSLALLEYDGLSQKEKVNRLGNKTYQFTVRYDNYGNDLSFLQNVGDYFKHDDEDDIIIYHREYSIYDTYVIATYFAAKDYVLKNYYTSVYARHRTWNLMSYGESVHRAENKKLFLDFSKNTILFEKGNKFSVPKVEKFLSCFLPSQKITSYDNYSKPEKINCGYITHYSKDYDENGKYKGESWKYYLTDVNSFLSGYSLCFNLKMTDNISMGSYISSMSPFEGKSYNNDGIFKIWEDFSRDWFDTHDDYTGSNISLYTIVDDQETGFIEKLGFYVGHKNTKMSFEETLMPYFKEPMLGNPSTNIVVKNIYESILLKLPLTNIESIEDDFSNKLGEVFTIYKDNKELIDMTYQIEPTTNDKDVLFSQWFMRLNDLLGNFYKTTNTSEYVFDEIEKLPENGITIDFLVGWIDLRNGGILAVPKIICKISKREFSKFVSNIDKKELFISFVDEGIDKFDFSVMENGVGKFSDEISIDAIKWKPQKIISFSKTNNEEKIKIQVEQYISINFEEDELGRIPVKRITTIEFIELKRIDEYYGETLNSEYVWFEYDFKKFTTKINNEVVEFGNQENLIINVQNNYNVTGYPISDIEVWGIANSVISLNSLLQKTYYKNMYVVTSEEPLRNTLVYDEYKQANFPNSLNVREDISISDVFKVGEDEHGSFIEIDITQFRYDDIKSIQYWYKDVVNNDPDNSLMKFVFGVNLTDEDLRHHTVKVYASLVSNRDTRVYDQNHNVVGEVVNYLDENNEKPYGQNQYYMVK